MKTKSISISLALLTFVCPTSAFQSQKKQQPLTEAQALEQIRSAEDAAGTIEKAKEFIKLFPNSDSRRQAVQFVADGIGKLKNAKEAVRLAEDARRAFTIPAERELIGHVLLDAYCLADKPDEAFALAAELLTTKPDDIRVLIQMTLTGTEQAKRKRRKYEGQSLNYGLKAISLIEQDKKPDVVSEESWTTLKAALPQLYQQTAVLNLIAGNTAEAQSRLSKASKLDPNDPYPFAVLGRMLDDEYTKRSAALASLSPGEAKELESKRVEELLDRIIETYAHTVALATGRFQYQSVMQQVVPSLTSHYKFRYKSTVGLRELIERYKR